MDPSLEQIERCASEFQPARTAAFIKGTPAEAGVNRKLSFEAPAAWLRWLRRLEKLGHLPSRFLTGHFVAIVAEKAP